MEVEEAALCLYRMKHEELDTKTSIKLQNLIRITESQMLHPVPPRQMFPASCPLPRLEINRKENKYNIGNKNVNKNVNKNKIESEEKLTQGVISLTRLPSLGQAIDGIVLPRLPPIEALQGKIVTCTMPFEKQLTKSDLSKSLARLMFCKDSVEGILKKFMTEEEYNKVTSKDGLEVIVYDQAGREYETKFILWSSRQHVLSRGWTEFFSKNNLQIHFDWVTVWMFQHTQTRSLCFAIVARRFPTPKLIGKVQKNGNKNKKQKREE